jgi:hypothetical protein
MTGPALRLLFACLSIMLGCVLFPQRVNSELIISHEFQLGDIREISENKGLRILPDNDPDRFWILVRLEGLYLLTEDPPGTWAIDLIPNDDLLDAVGPTSDGFIYCTAVTDMPESNVYIAVFDSSLCQFVDAIDLPWDYPINTITISSDEQKLYFTASTNYEHVSSTFLAPADSGLLAELDITSESVLRTASIQPWANSIFVWNDEVIFVSCDFWQYAWDPTDDIEEAKSVVDIVSVDSFTRTGEIYCGGALKMDTNDFITWDESHVALLNEWLRGDFEDPLFEDGIWLINPLTGAVDGTVRVNDVYGFSRGVRHACISRVRANTLYATPGTLNQLEPAIDHSVLVTDLDGNYIDRGLLPYGFMPQYIVETDCGQLVVTGTQYLESDVYCDVDKVFILEWPN